MFDLDTRTQRVRSAVLAGTSTAFDILYELSGRRLDLLQRSAAWLYERAEGDHPDLEPFQQAAAPQAPAPAPKPPAPEPVAAAPAAEPATEPATEPDAEPDAEAAPEPAQAAASEPEPEPFPIPGYDDLNVKVIVEALEALSPEALEAVRAYEAANKKRVTIDRAIKKLMEA